MKYGLVRLQNWKAAGGNTLAAQNTMLVRTCRMGNHPLGYMLGTDGWYTGLVGKEALMQFTTSLMLSTKLGLD
jgi:hypothetical protein